jgi:uncharacterized protein YceK
VAATWSSYLYPRRRRLRPAAPGETIYHVGPYLILTSPTRLPYGRSMNSTRIALSVWFTIFLSGCGTVCNLASGKPEPYGGVAKDVEFAAARQSTRVDQPQISGGSHPALVLALVMGASYGDFCASAVADSVTLPFILAWYAANTDKSTVKIEENPQTPAHTAPAPFLEGAGTSDPASTLNAPDKDR